MSVPLRGEVHEVDLGIVEPGGTPVPPKPWLIVSPNPRNRGLGTFLAVRITTTGKHAELPTVVALPHGEVVHGWVRCDSLETIYPEDLTGRRWGALSREAMWDVEAGLAAALGLDGHRGRLSR